MEHQKNIVVGSMLIVIFALAVSIITWYIQGLIYSGEVCSCFIPLPILIPLTGSIGLLTGTLVYYMFSPRFEKCLDRKTLLSFFRDEEAVIIDCLLDNRGQLSQSRIVRSTGLSKVKVHRVLERMRKTGVVEKMPNGKTNKILLKKEIVDIIGLHK